MSDFTLPDLVVALGFPRHDPELPVLGAAVRDRYRAMYGALPVKALRDGEANRNGKHCFAVYPVEFRPEAERVVRHWYSEKARQLSLFGD